MAKSKGTPGKVAANNTFEDGLIVDMNPMALPATALSDSINMEFVTTEGDQYVLQNMKGSKYVGMLPEGYEPLAVKEYQNIAYIVAGRFEEDGTFVDGMVGTYPSPDWTLLTPGTTIYDFDMPINKDVTKYRQKKRK